MTTDQVNVLKDKGNKAFSAGDHPTAVKFFSEAIALDPSNHILFSNRSASYSSLKQYNEALLDAEKAVALNPTWGKGYSRKGAALHGLQRFEDAAIAYQEGLKYEPENAQMKKGLIDIQKALAERVKSNPLVDLLTDPATLDKIRRNPALAHHLNDPEFVAKMRGLQENPQFFQKYIQDPKIMEVFTALLSEQFGKDDDAMDVDDKPVAEPPQSTQKPTEPVKASQPQPEPVQEQISEEELEERKNKEAALRSKEKGNEHYKKKEFSEAIACYNKAIELDPNEITYLNNRAAVYFEIGEMENCIKDCQDAVEKGREVRADYKLIAKALGRIGSAYQKLNNLKEAIRFYEKSLTEHRTPDVLTKLRECEKLKEKFEREAYIDPSIAEQEREKGNELFKKGDYPDAVRHYTEAIKRNPSDPRGYSNRAACYQKLAAIPEALKDCDECIRLDPKFVKAYIRKASIRFGTREYAKCLEELEKATEADTEGKHTKEIENQSTQCYNSMYSQNSNESKEDTLKRAAQDPEVQKIMADPVMMSILEQMRNDPRALQDHMKNPMVAAKIRRLAAAGIIRFG